jgi:hypothetical protein
VGDRSTSWNLPQRSGEKQKKEQSVVFFDEFLSEKKLSPSRNQRSGEKKLKGAELLIRSISGWVSERLVDVS